MKKHAYLFVSFIMCVLIACAGCTSDVPKTTVESGLKPNAKILVAYYSTGGHTTAVAKEIQKQLGGDLFQIKTKIIYPKNVPGFTAQVKAEEANNIRPELAVQIPDLNSYDIIFIGYPNWYDRPPMGVFTFLEGQSLKGKIIAPFVTYGLSGLGSSVEDIAASTPSSIVLKGLAIHASKTNNCSVAVKNWLTEIGLAKQQFPQNLK